MVNQVVSVVCILWTFRTYEKLLSPTSCSLSVFRSSLRGLNIIRIHVRIGGSEPKMDTCPQAHTQPLFSFSFSFCPSCLPLGFLLSEWREGGGGWPQIQGEGSVLALDETMSSLHLAGRLSHQLRLCGSCTAHENWRNSSPALAQCHHHAWRAMWSSSREMAQQTGGRRDMSARSGEPAGSWLSDDCHNSVAWSNFHMAHALEK